MFFSKVIFVLSAICAYGHSASIVANLKKCSLADDVCQKELYGNILQEVTNSGLPDMGIPAIDPFDVKDLEINILSMVKVGMTEGVVKGFKTCQAPVFGTKTETLTQTIEIVCEQMTVEGQYYVKTTPTLDALIGGIKIHGEGKGSVAIENIKINMEVPFEIKKLDDGELHAVLDSDKITYTYKVLGKATIAADNFYVGSQEISSVVVNIFNENWEFLVNSFGGTVVETAFEIFVKYANKFFAAVPMKDLISDDLTARATK